MIPASERRHGPVIPHTFEETPQLRSLSPTLERMNVEIVAVTPQRRQGCFPVPGVDETRPRLKFPRILVDGAID